MAISVAATLSSVSVIDLIGDEEDVIDLIGKDGDTEIIDLTLWLFVYLYLTLTTILSPHIHLQLY